MPEGARTEQQIFRKLRARGSARLPVSNPVQSDPFFLGESTLGHFERGWQKSLERLWSDELQITVTSPVGDPLGKDAEFHRGELAIRTGISNRHVAKSERAKQVLGGAAVPPFELIQVRGGHYGKV